MDKNLTPVLVTLCSQQRGEHGEADKPLRLICQGRMKKTQSGCMIRYQEVQNDEETGRPVSQDVLLHVQNCQKHRRWSDKSEPLWHRWLGPGFPVLREAVMFRTCIFLYS